jgi:hypothetical protein
LIYFQNHIFQLCNGSETVLGMMNTTYKTLNQLAGYYQQLRHTAIDESSLHRLIVTQKEIYDIMCSIKIALKTRKPLPEVTVANKYVSDIFFQYRQEPISRCIQQTSEYVTMLDTQKLSTKIEKEFHSLTIAEHRMLDVDLSCAVY